MNFGLHLRKLDDGWGWSYELRSTNIFFCFLLGGFCVDRSTDFKATECRRFWGGGLDVPSALVLMLFLDKHLRLGSKVYLLVYK